MKIEKIIDEIKISRSGKYIKKEKAKRIFYYCDDCNELQSCCIVNCKVDQYLNKEHHYCKKCTPKHCFNSLRGKTYEEVYGEEKAKELKKLRSEKNPGKLRKGKTNIEYYGEEKAKEIFNKHSIATQGEKNNMYGKPSPQGSGNGWCGWYKNYFFRSILELSFIINYVEKNNINVLSAEKIKIPYIYNENKRNYLPDYIDDNNKILYEIKPKHLIKTIENKLKFEEAEKWCLNNGYIFKVITEYDFQKLSTNDIKILRENNEIKFIDRYEKKFQEKYMSE